MSKIRFKEVEMERLNKNPNVERVSEKAITYTDEFKKEFIEEYLKGKMPYQIFQEAGFDIDIIGMKRVEQSACRWLKAYNDDGIIGVRGKEC